MNHEEPARTEIDFAAIFSGMSDRDGEIMYLVEDGHTTEYICDELDVTPNNVWQAKREFRRLVQQYENSARLINALT